MSTRKKLLISVSTVALIVGASAAAYADQTFTANHTANATAGGNESDQADKFNRNRNVDNVFQGATGVASELQNNGDNAALNNGNTVDAVISTGNNTGNVSYTAESTQNATQSGDSDVDETSVDDDNLAADDVFENAEGVFSKLQNNGAESAINNGNTVSAAILEGTTLDASLTVDSVQNAAVSGGDDPGNAYDATDSTNDNVIRDDAFRSVQGVASVGQNNGPSTAANNGNTVSAIISPGGAVNGNRTFNTDSRQSASVSDTNTSNETNNTDTNLVTTNAFEQAKGVVSALQNNGANSALNNGNTVSAIVTDGSAGTGFSTFTTESQQTATAGANPGTNSSIEDGSADRNTINSNAFRDPEGIVSAMQNNGANSAANNGNTVSAVIADSSVGVGRAFFTTESSQSATVQSGDEGSNVNDETNSPNTNTLTGNAFQSAEGVMSALQNNGANSALNNGNTVSAVVTNSTSNTASNDVFTTTSTQTARVLGGPGIASTTTDGNMSTQVDTNDTNTMSGAAFDNAEGIMSALQNNGANSAINNGNTVSAIVADGTITNAGGALRADSTQTARVDAGDKGINLSDKANGADRNTMTGTAFQETKGIGSAAQNNGANSALNNGNTVSAFVGDSSVSFSAATAAFRAPSAALQVSQSATVEATDGDTGTQEANRSIESGAGDTIDANTMTSETFENAQGVFSALQNNGANSAINNGNTVSAVVVDTTVGNATADFDTTSRQTALVRTSGNAPNNSGVNLSSEQDSGFTKTDTNTITSDAFRAAKGIVSAGQNNGANSAINNGNTVAAIVTNGNVNTTASDALDATSTQSATVESSVGSANADGNKSFEVLASDSNTISGEAFRDAKGIASALQNNGANSAINNGNTVSAVVTDGTIGSRANFAADSRQVARVSARDSTRNDDHQGNTTFADGHPSPESNRITGNAFRNAEGVFSVLQNNGPNSAINNGNTVSAFIADGGGTTVSLDNSSLLDTNQDAGFASTQAATVEAGTGGTSQNRTRQSASTESNRIDTDAFREAEGVASILQNNGGNSAINNGNTVAAVLAANGISGNQNATFRADSTQNARVNAVGGENLSVASDTADRGDSESTNLITNNAFNSGEGVFSVLQSNGGNSALNNGNVVSAFIAEGNVNVNNPNFATNSTQTARVDATAGGMNVSEESNDSDDTNTINSAAFSGTEGIASVTQNNGANSAINGGNTVSAIINDCASCTGTFTFMTTSAQTSTVIAGSASATHMDNSDNTNTMAGTAFSNVAGVFSVTQNNAPNSAISNGNTVSATIANN